MRTAKEEICSSCMDKCELDSAALDGIGFTATAKEQICADIQTALENQNKTMGPALHRFFIGEITTSAALQEEVSMEVGLQAATAVAAMGAQRVVTKVVVRVGVTGGTRTGRSAVGWRRSSSTGRRSSCTSASSG